MVNFIQTRAELPDLVLGHLEVRLELLLLLLQRLDLLQDVGELDVGDNPVELSRFLILLFLAHFKSFTYSLLIKIIQINTMIF